MSVPKYERLKQIIKNNIRDGIWRPGEKLPVEAILCDQFEVSKITIQKAKRELIAEGILETLPRRKGCFVKQRSHGPSTDFIGVAVDDIQDAFVVEMLRGIEDKLWENKLHTILCNTSFDIDKTRAYFASLIERQVAGVIFTPLKGTGYRENNRSIIAMLTDNQIPHILLDRYLPDCLLNSVVSNNRQASKNLTNLLLKRGHTRILVLTGAECSSINDRLQGYYDAFQEAGIEIDPRLIIEVNDRLLFQPQTAYQDELERVRHRLDLVGDFTACYTMHPLLQVVAQAIFASNNDINPRRELVTYDGINANFTAETSAMTVVKQPAYRMGWEAARLLIDQLNTPDQPIIQMTLQAEMIEKTPCLP